MTLSLSPWAATIAEKVGLKNLLRSFKHRHTGQGLFKALKSIIFRIRNIYKKQVCAIKARADNADVYRSDMTDFSDVI